MEFLTDPASVQVGNTTRTTLLGVFGELQSQREMRKADLRGRGKGSRSQPFVNLSGAGKGAVSCPALGKTLRMSAFFPALFLEDKEGEKNSSFIFISKCIFPGAMQWVEWWAPTDMSLS